MSRSFVLAAFIVMLGFEFTSGPALAQSWMGLCKSLKDEMKRIEACTSALESETLSPKDRTHAFFYRAVALYKERKYDTAISDLKSVLSLDPNFASAHFHLGLIYHYHERYFLAVESFSESLRIQPNFRNAHKYRGLSYSKLQKFKLALLDFDKAIDLNPHDPEAYNEKAWILATSWDPQFRNGKEAIKLAQEAVKRENIPSNRDTLAAAYAEAGQFALAVREQSNAIKLVKDAGYNVRGYPIYYKTFEDRLELYKNGKPYHQPNPDASKSELTEE